MDISQGTSLEKTVRRLKIQKILEIFFEAGAAFFTGLLLLLSAGLLIDHWLFLSSLNRQAYWVVSAAILVLILGKYLFYPYFNFSTLEILSWVEDTSRNLSLHLKSSWEFSMARGPKFHSQALEDEHRAETDRILKESPEIFLPFGNSARALFQWAVAAAFLMVLASYSHESQKRVLWPWVHTSLEKEVKVFPGDAKVDWGRSIEVKASWSKSSLVARDYRKLKIQVETPHGFEFTPWDSRTPNGAALKFHEIHSTLEYRLVFHEALTRIYSITPVLHPRLLSLEGKTKEVDSDWNSWVENSTMDVLSGHIFEIRGQPNEKLESAALLFSNPRRSLIMHQSEDGSYRASFVTSRDAALGFSLVSQTGEKNKGNFRYWIHVHPDLPPTVQILDPRYPVEGSRSDSLPISYLAQDDGGIVRILLSLDSLGRPSRELTIKTPDNAKEIYGDYSLNLSQLPVGVSEVRIKALDNAHPPHESYSSPIKIKVIDFNRIRRRVKKAWKEAEKSLSQLSDAENQVLSALKQNSSEAQKQASLSQADARQALQKMDELKRAMRRDPYLNSALKSSLASLEKRLEKELSRDFDQAKKNLAAGDKEKASEEHRRILNSTQQAGQFLSQAEKLRDLEDEAMSAAQMKNQASDLSTRLKNMSEEKSLSEARKAEIQKEISSLKKEIEKFALKMAKLPHSKGKSTSSAAPFPLIEARQSLNDLSQALASGNYSRAARIARQLEQEMEQMKSAMSQMAQNSVFSAEMQKAARQLAQARETLSQAIQKERAVRQETKWLEKDRLQREISKEKDLLEELSKMQGVLVSSAASYGGEFPPFILKQMESIQMRLKSGSAGNAEGRLLQVSNSLRSSSVFNPRFPWEYFAGGEDEIRKILEKGVSGISSEPQKSKVGAEHQGEAKEAAENALKQLKSLGMTVEMPEAPIKNLSEALGDEESAKKYLGEGQSQTALIKEESALSKLSQGLNSLDQSLNSEKSFESSFGEGFGGFSALRILGGGSPGEGIGANMNPAPLPTPKDYQPLKKMRREIEKSMKQKPPLEYQNMFKDYLRRISE